MAKPTQLLRVEWDARALKQIARDLERREAVLYRETGRQYLDTIRGKIRSRSGTLSRSWKEYRRGDTIILSSKTPYTYASVKGNWIRPKHGRAIKFQVAGKTVFAPRVRYPPGAYMGRRRGAGSSKSYLDDAARDFGKAAGKAFNLAYGSRKLGRI